MSMLWELDALKMLAKNSTVPGIALIDAIKEIERLQDANERLTDALDRCHSSDGYINVGLIRELREALGITDVPIERQLEAALERVKSLREPYI